jgi:hypothetical protein
MVEPCGIISRRVLRAFSRLTSVFMTGREIAHGRVPGTLPGFLRLPDLPARQHAQAKAVRADARTVVVEARQRTTLPGVVGWEKRGQPLCEWFAASRQEG